MGGAAAPRPVSAVQWRGHWFDPQTRDMLQELADRSGSIYVRPIQGCWSDTTTRSAETHTRACVVDVDCEDLTDAEAHRLVTLWRSMGGFGWFRPRVSPSGYVYGWQRHAHLGHPDGDMAPELRNQYADYLENRNGLANNGPDTETRAYVGMTWARYQKENPDTMTPEQEARILAAINGTPKKVWTYPLVNRWTKKAWSAGSYVEGGAVQALAKAQGLDQDAVLAEVGRQVQAALGQLELTITATPAETAEEATP